MTDFQYIEAKFTDKCSESFFECCVIVHRDDVGRAIEKITRFGNILRYTPESFNVTCIMDINLVFAEFLYKPRFAFHKTPCNHFSSLHPTLNSFMSNFRKNLKK